MKSKGYSENEAWPTFRAGEVASCTSLRRQRAARHPAYAVSTEAHRHVSSIPAGGSGLDRHRSSHAEANVQRVLDLTQCPAFGARRGHRRAPTINAYEELLPKRTEHHRLHAFFLVAAMDERVRVLEALQRKGTKSLSKLPTTALRRRVASSVLLVRCRTGLFPLFERSGIGPSKHAKQPARVDSG